ncbi:hypothetical protein KAM342_41970 [Aeromonas caviae]|uniref:Uncharacterized protein n=1 Tax=Aeromonas caviae TaxID=648 RepID=A0AAV4YUC2_AERCA|nr:hypothetical protein KAM341_42050 [Aeromonas caviae]GJA38954.1 hypothetical protein KAM342_41970 [Aeromonas caviae]GJA43498.1 hypothetical protein KAM343_42940 [Aeromonas caviae]GJA61249.1 hypothetical protein KAM350_42420 [Aeromonas caviae]GJA79193.1 hypothetical protein KAM354_44290 [Aeromonas caviae]
MVKFNAHSNYSIANTKCNINDFLEELSNLTTEVINAIGES